MKNWMALWAAGIVLLSSGVPVGVVAQGAQAPAAATRLLQRTPHFEVYLGTGSLSRADALRLAARLESTVEKVGQRLGMPFNARERIYFQAPQRGVCAVRGLTTSSRRQIQLFYGPGTEIDRLQAILAHELAHQLQRERFGDRVQRAADIVLLEGWAVVASDDFARTPDGSEARWRDRLREVVARNELLPLTVDLNQDCRTTTRNAIYDEWASFVDFLLKRNGNDALAALYRSSTGRRAGTANYQGVYGKSFMELEAEWRAWVITQ